MQFRIISLPQFRAAASEVDTAGDFAPDRKLRKFDVFFSSISPHEGRTT